MKFSANWLKQWVPLELDAAALAERLTAGGLEVDSVQPVAAPFEGVVVAEIQACEAHPDADKLRVCRIESGEGEPLQVVCGAPNARPGLKVPLARVGATLTGPDGKDFAIRKARLRGVESFGMACSARELGLSEDHSGLMELPQDAPVGADFRAWLELDDHSIDVDLTPNRADCLGIKGLARDVAAICGVEATPVAMEAVAPTIEDQFPVVLEDPRDCPRFATRVIRGIDPEATTPPWMVEALRRSGVRSISVAVDLTNYVLLELGQPMHAYDLATLQDGITVRRARKGEQLTLLDGKQIDLDDRLLAICDGSGPIGLGGIMGGLGTGVTDRTTDVLLEAAWFRPETIMGRARDLGMHTDASHRFERGVDPAGQVEAIERLTQLLIGIAGGEPGPVQLVEAPEHLPRREPVTLRLSRINRVLGSDLGAEEVSRILARLGMEAAATGEDGDSRWLATPPSARFDIAIEEDLIEEVARIHGYDNLPATAPSGELSLGGTGEHQVPVTQIREALCAAGYHEAITYAFVDRRLLETLRLDQEVLPLANPIASDMDVMRTALLPGLLTALGGNLRRQQDRVRLFEVGRVFRQGDRLLESEHLAAVACGSARPEQWSEPHREVDYYDLRRDLESLLALRGTGARASLEAAEFPWLHPRQSAAVTIDGQAAGWIGVLHPALQDELDLRSRVVAFEVELTLLRQREIPSAKKISPFPSVRRDLAFLLPEDVPWAEVEALVRQTAGELLHQLLVFDQFSGPSLEKGYKSLAIGLIFQDVSCNLTAEVVDSLVREIVRSLEQQLQAQLRG